MYLLTFFNFLSFILLQIKCKNLCTKLQGETWIIWYKSMCKKGKTMTAYWKPRLYRENDPSDNLQLTKDSLTDPKRQWTKTKSS